MCLGFIDDDPGVVPIIEPLRRTLDAIKSETASGWMFPNTIGGAIDLDNLADRLIKPMLKANGLKWKGWHVSPRAGHEPARSRNTGQGDSAILRHEDVKTTQRSYIKTVPSTVP